MTTWISSDHHFGHARIIEYCQRPFYSVEEMNAGLIERYNSRVLPEDECWFLGDFSMREDVVPGILRELNGTKYLIHGNHDRSHPINKRHEAAKQRYLQYGFAGVYHEVHNFHGFLLNHMPYVEEGAHGAKYAQWRPKDEGKFLCHGHLHSRPENRLRGNMLDVGVDGNNYYPISLDEIKSIVAKERLIDNTNIR